MVLLLVLVFDLAAAMSSDQTSTQASLELCFTREFSQLPCDITVVIVKETPYLVVGFDDCMIHIESFDGKICKQINSETPIQLLTVLATTDGETFIMMVDKDGLVRVRNFDGSLVRSFLFETGNLFIKKVIPEQVKKITAFHRQKTYGDGVTTVIVTDKNAYYSAACKLCARGDECTSSYWCSHWSDFYPDYLLANSGGKSIDAVAATTLSDDTALIAFVVQKFKIDLFRVYRPETPSFRGSLTFQDKLSQISDISFTRMIDKNCLLIRFEDEVLFMLLDLDTSDQDNLIVSVLDCLKVDKNTHSKILRTELGVFHMVVRGEAAKSCIEIYRLIQ